MAKKSKPRKTTKPKQSSNKSTYIFDGLVSIVRTLANSQRDWGVEKINEFADATKGYASSLKGVPNVGSYTKAASDSLKDLADYVNETEFDQILADSSTFAKRHPIIVVIGCAVAGVVVSQMLGSSRAALRTDRSARKRTPSASAKKRRGASVGGRTRKLNGQTHLNA
jgi:hypothetical protein